MPRLSRYGYKPWMMPSFCTMILILLSPTPICSQQPIAERWSRMADPNTAHQYHAAVSVRGKIYVVGGLDLDGEFASFEELDPVTNRWTTLPQLPTPRVFLGAAEVDEKIFAIGGLSRSRAGGYVTHGTVEAFDFHQSSWVKIANLPTPRSRLAVVSVSGRIYAIGGLDDEDRDSSVVEVYDPIEHRWERKTDMPTPRHGHSAVVVDGRILVVGGYRIGESPRRLATVKEYSPETDRWTKKANMPVPRGFFGLAAAGGYVFAMGGRGGPMTVDRYDPRTNRWQRVGPMPGGLRQRFGVAVVDDTIYVIGGEAQGDPDIPNSVLRYDPPDGP